MGDAAPVVIIILETYNLYVNVNGIVRIAGRKLTGGRNKNEVFRNDENN